MPEVLIAIFNAVITEFGWMAEPAAWAGLFALVTLEVVLGVDNLVFIAILADRVEPHQRDKARVVGLGMALMLRIALLVTVAHLAKLTQPLFGGFSGRDIIFILGGIFLLYKATSELHERLEATPVEVKGTRAYARFWPVVAQIMVLDAVFSLDAVITAVGMVPHVSVMIMAVTIAIGLMLLASKALTRFVNAHPTVVVLCLSFLLMIGFSLVAEGFGFHVPKEYLYAAIGFSVVIEIFNQIATSNYIKHQSKRPLRARTSEVILRLMGEKNRLLSESEDEQVKQKLQAEAAEESIMISGVLSLGERSLRSLMTPRSEMRWINIHSSEDKIRKYILAEPHSHFPLCKGSLDEIIGVARGAEILETLINKSNLEEFAKHRPPTVAPESMDAIRLLKLMRESSGNVVFAVDEFGSIAGLITPVDIFEIIAGEFREKDEKPDLVKLQDGSMLAQGHADLHLLEQRLDMEGLIPPDSDYGTVAGLLLDNLGHLPERGEMLEYDGLRFVVQKVSTRRIEEVIITRLGQPEEDQD